MRCCTGLNPCYGERAGGFVERHALSRLDEKKLDSFFYFSSGLTRTERSGAAAAASATVRAGVVATSWWSPCWETSDWCT
jgi:hypothetical protein